MRYINKFVFPAIITTVVLIACEKIGTLPHYENGKPPVLTSSATDIKPTPADSNKVVVTFSWTDPKYATDSSTQKFILEIDSAGRNFSKEITSTVSGAPGISF